MSEISDIFSDGIGELADAEATPTLEYKATIGAASWTAICGEAVLHRAGQGIARDDAGEFDQDLARLLCDASCADLAQDYYIRVGESDTDLYAVEDDGDGTHAKIYQLRRTTLGAAGPDRGRLPQ